MSGAPCMCGAWDCRLCFPRSQWDGPADADEGDLPERDYGDDPEPTSGKVSQAADGTDGTSGAQGMPGTQLQAMANRVGNCPLCRCTGGASPCRECQAAEPSKLKFTMSWLRQCTGIT